MPEIDDPPRHRQARRNLPAVAAPQSKVRMVSCACVASY
jgi:hypothetical protein